MSEAIAGIRIPDSKLACEAIDLLREHGGRKKRDARRSLILTFKRRLCYLHARSGLALTAHAFLVRHLTVEDGS